MTIYNKLVRDKIPQIIEKGGSLFRLRILSSDEYLQELRTKLREESEEYFQAEGTENILDELADMLEVIRALAKAHGASSEELEAIRVKKAEARGGFEDRVYLLDVENVVKE